MMELDASLFIMAGTASFLLKILIDGIKLGIDLPRWGVPLLALVMSPVLVWLLMVYGGEWEPTAPHIAGVALASIVTFGLAVGVTELGRRADARQTARGEGGTIP